MTSDIYTRQKNYYALNSRLSEQSNATLLKKIQASKSTQGWGINHQLTFGGQTIFIKRIPLTSDEYEHLFSTKNRFQLPNYYHYGVGSAGFGAFRELLCHIKTTNWVLQGEIENFPLLYHYRILHSQAAWRQRSEESLSKYVSFWNNNKRIESYIRARQEAPYEITLFLEFIPHSFHSWFDNQPIKNFQSLILQSQQALRFLKQKGMIHLDAHFANILTNGEQAFVSDFGLALDQSFELGKREQYFFDAHQDYDQGELLSCCNILLNSYFQALSVERQSHIRHLMGVNEEVEGYQLVVLLLEHIETLQTKDLLGLEAEHFNFLLKNREIICFMSDFYKRLRNNPKKNTSFDSTRLSKLLAI